MGLHSSRTQCAWTRVHQQCTSICLPWSLMMLSCNSAGCRCCPLVIFSDCGKSFSLLPPPPPGFKSPVPCHAILPRADGTRCPLVIFSAGFLLDASLYRTYARQLASWGYVAVLYDLSELRDDRQTVVAIRWGWGRGTRGGVCGKHKCRGDAQACAW